MSDGEFWKFIGQVVSLFGLLAVGIVPGALLCAWVAARSSSAAFGVMIAYSVALWVGFMYVTMVKGWVPA